MLNRRGFLGLLGLAAAAPLIAQPTLEEIERLTFRRRLFPGYAPSPSLEWMTREVLQVLKNNLVVIPTIKREYVGLFQPQQVATEALRASPDLAGRQAREMGRRMGETIALRKPGRFVELPQPVGLGVDSCLVRDGGVSVRGVQAYDIGYDATRVRFDVLFE